MTYIKSPKSVTQPNELVPDIEQYYAQASYIVFQPRIAYMCKIRKQSNIYKKYYLRMTIMMYDIVICLLSMSPFFLVSISSSVSIYINNGR